MTVMNVAIAAFVHLMIATSFSHWIYRLQNWRMNDSDVWLWCWFFAFFFWPILFPIRLARYVMTYED